MKTKENRTKLLSFIYILCAFLILDIFLYNNNQYIEKYNVPSEKITASINLKTIEFSSEYPSLNSIIDPQVTVDLTDEGHKKDKCSKKNFPLSISYEKKFPTFLYTFQAKNKSADTPLFLSTGRILI